MAHVVDAIMVTLGLDASKYTSQAENAIKTDARLEKSLDNVEKKGTSVSNNFENLGKAVKNATKVFASMAAATGIIKFLRDVAEETRQANEEMLKLQSSLGLTAEKINGMRGAGAALGGTAEGMTNSMKGLNKGMNDFVTKGDTTLLPFMNHLGVSMVGANGKLRDVDAVMLDLADSFSKMNSEQAYALGQDMGFDEGTIAALMQGRDAMKEMSEYHAKMYTSSKEELAASRELSKNQAQLSAHWQSMKLMMGNAVIPLLIKLTNIAKAFFEFLQEHQSTVKRVFEAMAFLLGAILIPLFGKALLAALAFIAPFAPFILVITAIGAAFIALYDDYKVWSEGGQSLFDWGKFAELIDGTKLSVDALTNGFSNLAKKVMAEVIPTLKGYGSIITKIFEGDFKGASLEAAEMMANLGDKILGLVGTSGQEISDKLFGGGSGESTAQPSGKPTKGFTKGKAEAIAKVAKNIGVDPNDLAAVISFETGGTFDQSIRNPKSSATGLIQFMKGSGGTKGKYYGMSRDEFGALSFEDQMKYVEKYFKERGFSANKKRNVADTYTAVTGYGYKRGSAAYELNKVWDSNKDGYIDKGEMVRNKSFQAHQKQYYPSELKQNAAEAQAQSKQGAMIPYRQGVSQLQSNTRSSSVDVKIDNLNVNTSASTISGTTQDAMDGVRASIYNMGVSMA